MALRNDLTTMDVKVLYFLSQPHENCTLKEMADILNISRRQLSGSIQRMQAREMLTVQEEEKDRARAKRGTREKQQENGRKADIKEYMVTQEAENILSEILFVLCDFEQIQYEGFSQEEMEIYERLEEMRRKNIRKALRT